MTDFRIHFIFPLIWAIVFFVVDLYTEDAEVTGHHKIADLKKPGWFYIFIVTAPVVYFATIRDWFADTGAYLRVFRNMPDSWAGIPAYMSTATKDRGFFFLS